MRKHGLKSASKRERLLAEAEEEADEALAEQARLCFPLLAGFGLPCMNPSHEKFCSSCHIMTSFRRVSRLLAHIPCMRALFNPCKIKTWLTRLGAGALRQSLVTLNVVPQFRKR